MTIASNAAAVIGFIIARYLARKFVETRLGSKGSRWRLIGVLVYCFVLFDCVFHGISTSPCVCLRTDNAISKDGFRIVFLIRCSPIHPYGVCNYLFGVTSINLRDYTIASFLGAFSHFDLFDLCLVLLLTVCALSLYVTQACSQ